MSEELKVPKRRAPVEVLFPGGAARRVTVFLAEFASNHSGPERISDLLNGGTDFVPAIDLESGRVTFLGRQGIAAARVEREWESEPGMAATSEHAVQVTLVDGTVLRGTVGFAFPPERSRLLDYLNGAPPFVRLSEKDHVALINKRHIAQVAPLE
jgi:hypothetical protein